MNSFVIICNSGENTLGLATLNDETGQLSAVEKMPIPDVTGPSGAGPLAISPDGKMLYLAFRGEQPRVFSFAINYAAGSLDLMGQNPLPDSMVHISTDQTGRFLFSASYGAGIFAVNDIDANGIAGGVKQVCEAEPKAHCTLVARDNRSIFVPSIDAEAVLRFEFDIESGEISRAENPAANVVSVSGPRHLTFHPSKDFAYLVNEYSGTVTVFACENSAEFKTLQTVSILPNDFSGVPSSADIHLTPNGDFLYATDRGSNVIAGYRVDQTTGQLTEVTKISVAEKPRGFNIDPSGKWLVILSEMNGTVAIYAIDQRSGLLEKKQELPTGAGANWVEILPHPSS